jgi:hypothetical protein
MNSSTSLVVMPSRRMLAAATCTASVMSLARCIRAISASDLRVRQWAVTARAFSSA